jgi:hypothetical protein
MFGAEVGRLTLSTGAVGGWMGVLVLMVNLLLDGQNRRNSKTE